jgi:hypothetical protein
MLINFFSKKCLKDNDCLNVFEKLIGSKLPNSYRTFLIDINGGIPFKKYFLYNNTGSLIKCFFGITNEKDFDIVRFYNHYKNLIPEYLLPIGEDDGGNILMMAISGKDYGKLFFLDHEQPICLLANSFEEFINSLKSEEEIDELLSEDKE